MDKLQEILFGKNPLDRITNLEVTDSGLEVYRELTDGSVDIQYLKNKYYALTPYPFDKDGGWVRLKGDQHYKWGKQFDQRADFLAFRGANRSKDIFSIYDSASSIMIKDGYTYYKGMDVKDVSVLSFDIETTGFLKQGNKLLLISNTFRKGAKTVKRLFAYDDFKNEGHMLAEWCRWVREMNPSILMGHNIYGFDLPFIQEVADREHVDLELGRDNSPIHFNDYTSEFRKDGSQTYKYHRPKIYGRDIVDTFFLSIKYDATERKFTSYGLKNIIKEAGLESANRVFYDASKIKTNYKDPVEWEKIKKYCENDSDDSLKLFDMMVPPFFYMAQNIPKTFQGIIESASGSQLNSIMLRSYLQQGHSVPKASEAKEFEGAVSMGNPGIYKNVFKVDVKSMYPSIMLQHKVFDAEKDPESNLLKILQYFTTDRLKNKQLAKETGDIRYKHLEASGKIFINSLYGFMGATGLNYNYPKGAAQITRTGREILNKTIAWASAKNFEIVNADTDSISFCRHDEAEMPESQRSDLLNELNSLQEELIRFEDDGYYKMVVVLKAKNYILFDGVKTKIKGSSMKSSTRETALKELIGEVVEAILKEKYNYLDIYNKYVLKCLNITDSAEMKKWSSKKTITNKVLSPERTNEQKILNAINEDEVQEGDKVWVYFKPDATLGLADKFDGNYDPFKLMQKIWNCMVIFENILDIEQFPKYHLKTKRSLLANLGVDSKYYDAPKKERKPRAPRKRKENTHVQGFTGQPEEPNNAA